MNYEVITCPRLSDWSRVVNWDNVHSLHFSHVAQDICSGGGRSTQIFYLCKNISSIV